MQIILATKLKGVAEETVALPAKCRILGAQGLYGDPVVWVLSDMDEKGSEEHRFRLIQTGRPFKEGLESYEYLGSLSLETAGKSYSIFEYRPPAMTVGPEVIPEVPEVKE